jgi:branched-chain amino acid aminotransferase
MKIAKYVWFDGRLVRWSDARIHVLTHALAHGTGVFEGVRCHPTPDGAAVFRLDDHVARLFRSARTMLMGLHWRPEDVSAAVTELIDANGQTSSYLRLIAFRAYGEMFVNPRENPVSLVVASWEQPHSFSDQRFEHGLRLMVSSWRRPDPNTIPTGAKLTGAYAMAGLARMEAEAAGYDDAIMLGSGGMLAEAVIANLFLVRDGRLYTPTLADGPLAGITRDTVLTLARDIGFECVETSLTRSELYAADEIFLTGTGVGIVPVAEVEGRRYETPAPVTSALQAQYQRVTHGSATSYEHWLTPVSRAADVVPAAEAAV